MRNPLICIVSVFVLFAYIGGAGPALEAQERNKLPVIVDTDMGFDDWMAVLYLLNKPDIEVVAITVDGAGETYTPQGAVNATKLLGLADRTGIPVYFGKQPKATLDYQFPEVIRKSATAMEVPGFENLPATKDFSKGAGVHLMDLAIEAGKSGKPLTVLSIGTATNLARAIEQAKKKGQFDAFAKGITMVFKGGGAFGKSMDGKLTNEGIAGNLNIPGLYESDNKTAAWNVYANAAGSEALIESGLPVTFVPINLSDQVKITESSFDALKKVAVTGPAKFVVSEIEDTVNSQGGWSKAELEYWDPSVVVAGLNPGFIKKKYDDVRVCVDARKGDTHGTVYVDTEAGTSTQCAAIGSKPGTVSVYTAIDVEAFYQDFFSTLNRP